LEREYDNYLPTSGRRQAMNRYNFHQSQTPRIPNKLPKIRQNEGAYSEPIYSPQWSRKRITKVIL